MTVRLFLFTLLLTMTSCSKYNIEALVQVENNNSIQPFSLQQTQAKLSSQLKEAGFSKVKIKQHTKENQLTILAKIDKDQQNQLPLFRSKISNSTMGFWNTYRVNDEAILNIKSDLPTIPGFTPNPYLGLEDNLRYMGGKEVLGEAYDPQDLKRIKKELEQSLKKYKNLKLLWSAKPIDWSIDGKVDVEAFFLYMIDTKGEIDAPVTGKYLEEANTALDNYTGEINIDIKLNEEGSDIWARTTKAAAADNYRSIAIVVKERVLVVPSVRSEITGGKASISGNFTLQQAAEIEETLKGIINLPYQIYILEEKIKN